MRVQVQVVLKGDERPTTMVIHGQSVHEVRKWVVQSLEIERDRQLRIGPADVEELPVDEEAAARLRRMEWTESEIERTSIPLLPREEW